MILDKVYQKLEHFAALDNILLSEAKMLLAVSGGVDSMTLLHVIKQIRDDVGFEIALGHVNHGYRSDADDDEAFCREQALNCQAPFYAKRLNILAQNGSFENWARVNRYQFLLNTAKDFDLDWVLTAHHEDDQVETIFMRLTQKAEWDSLLGIREVKGRIRRPLLTVAKSDILEYSETNRLIWHEDPSNSDVTFLRNRIRLLDLPEAIQKEPGVRDRLLNESQKSMKKLDRIRKKLSKVKNDLVLGTDYFAGEIICDRDILCSLPSPDRKILIQSMLADIKNDDYITVTAKHWTSLWQFIAKSRTGMVFEFTNEISILRDRTRVILFENKILCGNEKQEIEPGINKWGHHQILMTLVKSGELSPDKSMVHLSEGIIKNSIFVRQWKSGDRIDSHSLRRSVKLSDLFVNMQMSLLEKKLHPVVVNAEDAILWIPGVAHNTQAYESFKKTGKFVSLIWSRIKKK